MEQNANTSIETLLRERGTCLFQTVGDSMEPLLHNRMSSVLIERTTEPLKKYDVALFRRPTGEYVLHRVVGVSDCFYRICGDNQAYIEKVPYEWVLGRMTGFYPDQSDHFITDAQIRQGIYLRLWWLRFALRYITARKNGLLRRIRRIWQ